MAGNSKLSKRLLAGFLIFSCALPLAGCTTASPIVDNTNSEAAANGEAKQVDKKTQADTSQVFRTSAKLGNPVISPDGYELTVSQPVEMKRSIADSYARTPLKFVLTVRNNSTHVYKPVLATQLTSGTTVDDAITDERVKRPAGGIPALQPGEAFETEFAYAVTDVSQMQLLVDLDSGGQRVSVTYFGEKPSAEQKQ